MISVYKRRSAWWPNVKWCAVSLLVAGGYIYVVSAVFALITGSSLLITLLVVSVGTVIQLFITCELSRRFYLSDQRAKRFGLGTLILVLTGLSIYLAAISCLIRRLSDEFVDLPLLFGIALVVLGILFVVTSTMVLTHFAEALVWTWISTRNTYRIRRRKQ